MTVRAGYVRSLLTVLFLAPLSVSGQARGAQMPEQKATQGIAQGSTAGALSSGLSATTGSLGSLSGIGGAEPALPMPTQSFGSGAAPRSTAAALARMAGLAGVIFAGEVIAVRRPTGYAGSPQSAAEGVVEVEFRVDEAVRGCTAGSRFVLKEWAGLWAGGIDRYTVGQRLLLFLHAPSAQGMSSPIDGMDGAIPLQGNGSAPSAPGVGDTRTTPGGWMVDLRWLQAQVLRGSSSARVAVPMGKVGAAGIRAEVRGSAGAPAAPVAWRAVSAMPQQESTESLQAVLTLCRQWEQQSDAAR